MSLFLSAKFFLQTSRFPDKGVVDFTRFVSYFFFLIFGAVLFGVRPSSSSPVPSLQRVTLRVHMLRTVSWDLIVAFKVRVPSVVTHDCLTELCLEFRMLFLVFVLSPLLLSTERWQQIKLDYQAQCSEAWTHRYRVGQNQRPFV